MPRQIRCFFQYFPKKKFSHLKFFSFSNATVIITYYNYIFIFVALKKLCLNYAATIAGERERFLCALTDFCHPRSF